MTVFRSMLMSDLIRSKSVMSSTLYRIIFTSAEMTSCRSMEYSSTSPRGRYRSLWMTLSR